MTQEQKAKAYDKAVKEASIAYKDEDKHLKATLERIFPELGETEDERLRKDIIRVLKGEISFTSEKENEKYIAWLEKQCKKSVWTDNDRIMAFTLLRDVTQMTHLSNEGKNERLEWLNTLEDRLKK